MRVTAAASSATKRMPFSCPRADEEAGEAAAESGMGGVDIFKHLCHLYSMA
jgi:hypothetical protein